MLLDIVGWGRFNSRKPLKGAVWFSFENDFFDDPALFGLGASEKLLLVYLKTLRSKTDGPFKLVAAHAMHHICCNSEQLFDCLAKLVERELVREVGETTAGIALAVHTDRQTDKTNKQTSSCSANADDIDDASTTLTDSECQEDKQQNLTPSKLLQIWNDNCGSLAAAERMTQRRRKMAATRIKENPDPEYWTDLVRRLAISDLANGRVKNDKYPNGWFVTFLWLIKNEDNHVKVAEGNYDNKKASHARPQPKFVTEADLDFRS